MPYAKPKYETAGSGCLVQFIGLILLFFFPVGTLLGIGLMIGGSVMSRKWRCSACGNQLVDQHVRICPTCRIEYNEKAKWYQL